MLNKPAFPHSTPFRKAKALYACQAEHDSELSFTAGTIFDNGEFPGTSQKWRASRWLKFLPGGMGISPPNQTSGVLVYWVDPYKQLVAGLFQTLCETGPDLGD